VRRNARVEGLRTRLLEHLSFGSFLVIFVILDATSGQLVVVALARPDEDHTAIERGYDHTHSGTLRVLCSFLLGADNFGGHARGRRSWGEMLAKIEEEWLCTENSGQP
jgi:hypothetical protein